MVPENIRSILNPCPCCSSLDLYYGGCLHPEYGRIVCRNCGLGTTPDHNSAWATSCARWNVRGAVVAEHYQWVAIVDQETKKILNHFGAMGFHHELKSKVL